MTSRSGDDNLWQGGPCRGPFEGHAWHESLRERDRQVVEDGRQLQKFYESREAIAEKKRLAAIRERQEWEVKWREYRFNGGPKPAPPPEAAASS
jgi:hypothetical protein